MSAAKSQLIARKRDRAIATLLSFKEDEVDPFIDNDVSDELRKLVLDLFNDVANIAIDLVDESSVINEIFLDRIEEIVNG